MSGPRFTPALRAPSGFPGYSVQETRIQAESCIENQLIGQNLHIATPGIFLAVP